jgi:NAD(P)H-hydrate epimerase
MTTETITERELARLIAATGRAHHAAFKDSDGVDPDWALWYAGYLQATLWDRLGSVPSRSELTWLLVGADRAYRAVDETGDGEPGAGGRGDWPTFYARLILSFYRGG